MILAVLAQDFAPHPRRHALFSRRMDVGTRLGFQGYGAVLLFESFSAAPVSDSIYSALHGKCQGWVQMNSWSPEVFAGCPRTESGQGLPKVHPVCYHASFSLASFNMEMFSTWVFLFICCCKRKVFRQLWETQWLKSLQDSCNFCKKSVLGGYENFKGKSKRAGVYWILSTHLSFRYVVPHSVAHGQVVSVPLGGWLEIQRLRLIHLVHLFVYFWLHWVLVALRQVMARRGCSSLWYTGFITVLLLRWNMGSRPMDFSRCSTWAQ